MKLRLKPARKEGAYAEAARFSIAWLRSHHDAPVRLERLAQAAHMNPYVIPRPLQTRVTAMARCSRRSCLRLQEANRHAAEKE